MRGFFFQRAQDNNRERNLCGHTHCAMMFTVGQARYSLWGEDRWGKRAAYAIVSDAKTGGNPTDVAFCACRLCSPFSVVG